MIPPPAYEPKASFVYLLRSKSTGAFYVGWSTDLNRRVTDHNSGNSSYTKSRGPWELVGYEEFDNQEKAKKREKTLKHNPRMMLLFKKRLINLGPSGQRQVVG